MTTDPTPTLPPTPDVLRGRDGRPLTGIALVEAEKRRASGRPRVKPRQRPLSGKLSSGVPWLLGGDRRGADAKAYAECYDALAQQYGPFVEPLLRLEAARLAAQWVTLLAATHVLTETRDARMNDKGRRPHRREVSRAEKRQGLNNIYYERSLERFEKLVAKVAAIRAQQAAGPASGGWGGAGAMLHEARLMIQPPVATNGGEVTRG